ncbi:MAG: hypothetical protein AAGA53_16695 [Pseudomonadota bacterium]
MNDKNKLAKSRIITPQQYPKSLNVKREAELEYLSDMLPQLRKMALGLDEARLAYLLELAMMEAQLQFELERFESGVEQG